jgi:hypothetical protein
MLALPIPDERSPVSYADLRWRGRDVGELVRRLTRGEQQHRSGAHLDPDLRADALPRAAGWRPALGQLGAAQGHLRNRAVGPGDLFLFWGLYRDVDRDLRWVGRARHVIWGWLQVGAVAGVDELVRPALRTTSWRWAGGHPHLVYPPDPSNTLYVAADRLSVPGARAAAAGVLEHFHPARQLTAPDARTPSSWLLPAFMMPNGRPALSYHDDPARWTRQGTHVALQAASRGQEFVLDASLYDGALDWVASLLRGHGGRLASAEASPPPTRRPHTVGAPSARR